MEEIIRKINELSKEITNFVIANKLTEGCWTYFKDEENKQTFDVYQAEEEENTTAFSIHSTDYWKIVQLHHYSNKVTMSVDMTTEILIGMYEKLIIDFEKFKIAPTTEDVKERIRKDKLKKIHDLQDEVKKLEEDLYGIGGEL